jgi:hypothetical protein
MAVASGLPRHGGEPFFKKRPSRAIRVGDDFLIEHLVQMRDAGLEWSTASESEQRLVQTLSPSRVPGAVKAPEARLHAFGNIIKPEARTAQGRAASSDRADGRFRNSAQAHGRLEYTCNER